MLSFRLLSFFVLLAYAVLAVESAGECKCAEGPKNALPKNVTAYSSENSFWNQIKDEYKKTIDANVYGVTWFLPNENVTLTDCTQEWSVDSVLLNKTWRNYVFYAATTDKSTMMIQNGTFIDPVWPRLQCGPDGEWSYKGKTVIHTRMLIIHKMRNF